jgi:hypothetical protein
MAKNINGGKFGLVIPELTEARKEAEAQSYNAESRTHYETAKEITAPLIERVNAYLEKRGAPLISDGGADMFGVITSPDDPEAPCGITFYGPRSLAEAVASVFSKHKVISARNGAAIKPARVQRAGLRPINLKPRA